MNPSRVLSDPESIVEAEEPSGEAPTPQTILIVDDSPVDRQIAAGLVSRRPNLRAITASDGQKALDLIEREAPSVVVTDLQMPGMNGLELVEQVRKLHAGIPLILMTAYGSEEIAMNALRVGAANYVPKKALARELVDTINAVIAASSIEPTRQRLLSCVESSRLALKLKNDPTLIAPLIALLQEDLAGMGICDSNQRTRVGVALQEALANALYHGNLGVSSELRQEDERVFYQEAASRCRQEPYCHRRIHVSVEFDRAAAVFRIRDDGTGFDTSSIDAPFDPESLMRIGGRGMLLIRTFMDEVRHNETGNEITLIKRRGGG